MKPLWLTDILAWQKTSLKDRLECLRLYHCTGPCGQSHSTMVTRQATDEALSEAIEALEVLSQPDD